MAAQLSNWSRFIGRGMEDAWVEREFITAMVANR